MADSSISVCVRIRPFSEKEAAQLAPTEEALPFLGDGGLGGSPLKPALPGTAFRKGCLRPIVKPMDEKVLVFDPPDTSALSRLYNQNHLMRGAKKSKDVRYAFDRVFDASCTQQDVFEQTCKPLLDGILNGYNASVFAYGATGCGKTHTISGTPQDPGLIFLTMKELYNRIEDARLDSEVHIRLSYLEIYNETIRDLLSPEPTPPGQGLALREDSNNKISVVGITELIPSDPESVLSYIQEGNLRRTMSPTEANAVSSRSHAVLQINVTQKPRTADTTEETTSASLNIIDLAGSERASATRNNGARMKEGANINKSLLALGNCINALCQSGGLVKHVPYRNSKLTRLLKFSLGGNCKTVMVVCVSPSSSHYEETHNALKYANQAKNIRTKVSRNMINVDRHVAQYVQAIHELKEENNELRAKLAEKGSYETAAEKRKKAEALKELDEAKRRMTESTESVARQVKEKGGWQGKAAAAQVRLSLLKKRLVEVQTQLAKYSPPLPSDLEGERVVLESLVLREESLLKSERITSATRSLANSLQMQRGIIIAASQNQKFDAQLAEQVKLLGASLLAETEAAQAKAKYEAVLASTTVATPLITLATRSTIALKEVAGELEYRATHDSEEMGPTLTLLASQLRSISAANDQDLTDMAGESTPAPAAKSTLRRSTRMSIGGVAPPTTATLSRRASIATRAAPPSSSPRKTARRPSLGVVRRASLARPLAPPAKKTFRWADEAGGTLDDKIQVATSSSPTGEWEDTKAPKKRASSMFDRGFLASKRSVSLAPLSEDREPFTEVANAVGPMRRAGRKSVSQSTVTAQPIRGVPGHAAARAKRPSTLR